MSTNKETLFRFVSLRGPELLKEENRENQFITFRDSEGLSVYRDVILDPLYTVAGQHAARKAIAESFTPFTTAAQLKTHIGANIYDLSRFIAENRYGMADGTIPAPTYANEFVMADQLIPVWDSLFYYLDSGSNPMLLQQLADVLVAIHFMRNFGATPERVLARIVIPPAFFVGPQGDYVNSIPPAALPALSSATISTLERVSKGVLARDRAERLQETLDEFRKAEKFWEDKNSRDYQTQKYSYDVDVAGIIEDAETQVDPESRKVLYTDPLELPAFSFTPVNPLAPVHMADFLSPDSVLLVEELGLYDLPSMNDAIRRLQLTIQEEVNTGFSGNDLHTPVVNVNNLTLEVPADLPQDATPYSYLAKVIPSGTDKYKVWLHIYTPYARPALSNASFRVAYPLSSSTAYIYGEGVESQASRYVLSLDMFPNGMTLPSTVDEFEIEGTVTLSNGARLSIDMTVSITEGSNGVLSFREADDIEEGTGPSNVYIPSGFGLKRLGIADYRKVEQETCCYVPGDVSHIENVMAREYKEKSTRRLRRSEETTTTSSEMEKESQTDTSTTSRHDMQQETANVISKDIAANANTSLSGKYGGVTIGVNASYAQNNSQQQSSSQAVSYAKDVTERALERVVQRVKEERVIKVVEEFEEQNKHGFDNRKGDKHVSGVYRWVDKIYKNTIHNYGKRLMYEFMLPQPAAFHLDAMKTIAGSSAVTLIKPVDPRSADAQPNRISSFTDIDEYNYKFWAAAYGAEIEPCPELNKTIGKTFTGVKVGDNETLDGSADVTIPDGYVARSTNVKVTAKTDGDRYQAHVVAVTVGSHHIMFNQNVDINENRGIYHTLDNYTEQIPVSFLSLNFNTVNIAISVKLEASAELLNRWKIQTFDAILKAYERKKLEYEDALASVTATSKTANPGFYRQIENNVLRKNCISYLVGHNNLGKEMYTGEGVTGKQINDTANLDRYASLVKFIEQAFEWEEISYNFYPYYWADKTKWQELYQQEVDDALFRSFLQSGMARVIAPVRPGFEEAVMFYMVSGQVWNGNNAPIIGDDLYLSVIDELKNPEYTIEESWETRVPTSLTIIQAGAVGLEVDGLPCACGDTETGFSQTDDLLGVQPEEEAPTE